VEKKQWVDGMVAKRRELLDGMRAARRRQQETGEESKTVRLKRVLFNCLPADGTEVVQYQLELDAGFGGEAFYARPLLMLWRDGLVEPRLVERSGLGGTPFKINWRRKQAGWPQIVDRDGLAAIVMGVREARRDAKSAHLEAARKASGVPRKRQRKGASPLGQAAQAALAAEAPSKKAPWAVPAGVDRAAAALEAAQAENRAREAEALRLAVESQKEVDELRATVLETPTIGASKTVGIVDPYGLGPIGEPENELTAVLGTSQLSAAAPVMTDLLDALDGGVK
jgi:hypothetical protein